MLLLSHGAKYNISCKFSHGFSSPRNQARNT
uniref:Uncharacterized protein n=1 Tax=Arundo donax TaxID=35708 RepID=A0A0A8XU50_ARUDO